MRVVWSISLVLVAATASFADPRFEIGAGAAVDHLSGGICGNGGFEGSCAGRTGASLQLDAGEIFDVRADISVIARELVGVGAVGSHALARGYLGIGARVLFGARFYVELTAGGETLFSQLGTGESGIASGASLALSPRIGVGFGQWVVAVNGMWAPQATGQVGLADYDGGLLVSRRFGD